MSEYQYYEFQAVDRPLSAEQQEEVRSLSSRAEVSPFSAVFTYSFGDFRGNPMQLLANHFDGLLYLANWGSQHLHFRLPLKLVQTERLTEFCIGEEIAVEKVGESLVLSFTFEEEEIGWIEANGDLGMLMPLRQQILDGDLRVVYLAWLRACEQMDPDDLEDEELTLSVPPGLGELDRALENFVSYFCVDPDLVAASAKYSPKASEAVDLVPLLGDLSDSERLDFLTQVLAGELGVGVKLRQRLMEMHRAGEGDGDSLAGSPKVNFSTLLEEAQAIKQDREARENKAKEKARLAKLNDLALRAPQVWREVEEKINLKNAGGYTSAIGLLKQLEELACHQEDRSGFLQRVRALHVTYAKFTSFGRRLADAGWR